MRFGNFFFDLAATIALQFRFCLIFATLSIEIVINRVIDKRQCHAARHNEVRQKEGQYGKFAKHDSKIWKISATFQ
jgi:hypothetical protein